MIHWGEGGGKEGTVEALLWQRCFLAMLQRLFRESAFLFWAFLIPMALNEHIWGLEIEERIQQLQLLTSNSTVARPWHFFSASFLAELAEKGKAGSSGNQEKPPLAKPNYLGRSRKIRWNPRASKRIERIPCWHATDVRFAFFLSNRLKVYSNSNWLSNGERGHALTKNLSTSFSDVYSEKD